MELYLVLLKLSTPPLYEVASLSVFPRETDTGT